MSRPASHLFNCDALDEFGTLCTPLVGVLLGRDHKISLGSHAFLPDQAAWHAYAEVRLFAVMHTACPRVERMVKA